jgi:hypothetical protein
MGGWPSVFLREGKQFKALTRSRAEANTMFLDFPVFRALN